MDSSSSAPPPTFAIRPQQKLSNRYEQDLCVAFPLQPLASSLAQAQGQEEDDKTKIQPPASWLTEESYQTYAVRGGTDKTRDNLRRRVEMNKFHTLHPESDLLKAIFEPRGRGIGVGGAAAGVGGGGKFSSSRQDGGRGQRQYQGGQKGGGKRRRSWEGQGGGQGLYGRDDDGGGGDDYDDDENYVRPSGGSGGGEAAVGRILKLGPVAKLRNSSLTLQEHQQYQTLVRKQQRFEAQFDDARPLTAEERHTLGKLQPLVRAEQEKYGEALKKWIESGRAPYRQLEKALGEKVDAYIAALKEEQKATLPRRYYQMHFKSAIGGEQQAVGYVGEPAYLFGIKAADISEGCVCVPVEKLPLDVSKEEELKVGEGEKKRLHRMATLGKKENVFEDADILVDLDTLLALADPTLAWTIPFTLRMIGGGNGEEGEANTHTDTHAQNGTAQHQEGGKKVLVLHSPLLPPTLSWRERANMYYRQVVPKQLRAATEKTDTDTDTHTPTDTASSNDDCTLSLEAWQLAQLKVVVASDRIPLSKSHTDTDTDTQPEEALLTIETDYALEWSEEEAPHPHTLISTLIYNWVACNATPYTLKIDGKNSHIHKLTSRREDPLFASLMASGGAGVYMSEVITRLLHVLGLLQKQAVGEFVVRHDPGQREMVVYHHVEGLGGEKGGDQVLDLEGYVEESGRREEGAGGSWRKWRWPAVDQHIPGTFVPRQP